MRKTVTGIVAAGLLVGAVVQAAPGQSREPREPRERASRLNVSRTVEALDLEPGMHVADIGAGAGLFARAMARVVGDDGLVYAVDTDPDLLAYIDEMSASDGLTNLQTVHGTADDPEIPSPVDLITMFETLHHIGNRPAYLKRLRSYLRPGGRVAIVDFTSGWPEGHRRERYTERDLARWMQAAGFRLERRYRFIENHFFVIYRLLPHRGTR
ncbi:MAG: class I SAM-dependent methyltransferase [Acidobacteriota bacterium]|nr:class I SAM-dependent methyltransferase [Acidobacteriota bacterium]